MRAYRKLNGHVCPGERFCTSNKVKGEIAGLHGQKQGRTLENYCHNDVPSATNGKMHGCPLFETKPENVPPSLSGAIDTAETLRKYKQRGCLPDISEMTAWEFCCFDAAEEASEVIEAEAANNTTSNTTGTNTEGTGKQTPMGELGKGGGALDW